MREKWLILAFVTFAMAWGQSFAAKPQNNAPALPAPQIFSVKIDYTNGFVIVQGENLDTSSTVATLAGVSLSLDGSSSDTTLLFPFSPALSAAVPGLGNYVLNISIAGNNFSLTLFIPIALAIAPPPPPPGPECPCSTEWDQMTTAASPDGVAGQTPYCNEDSPNFVTVQFYDIPAYNYWVLWTEWTGSDGYCELYLDGPYRTLTRKDQFDACAAYLRNIVTVWGTQGNDCML
jgi:hypothetical protein